MKSRLELCFLQNAFVKIKGNRKNTKQWFAAPPIHRPNMYQTPQAFYEIHPVITSNEVNTKVKLPKLLL